MAFAALALAARPALALYVVPPPAEVAAAIRFGLDHPPLRWPGENPEWHTELLIRFSDARRFRTIQVTLLTPWLQVALAAWESPLTFNDPAAPQVLDLVARVQNRLHVLIWYVPAQRDDVAFRAQVAEIPVSLIQGAGKLEPVRKVVQPCRTTRWSGCVGVEHVFPLDERLAAAPFTVFLATGGDGYALRVDPQTVR